MKIIRKQNTRKTKFWKYGAFDIETQGLNANAFLFGTAIWKDSPGSYQKKVFFDKDEMAEFLTRRSFRGYKWYSHNGGKYDLISLFGNYLERDDFSVVLNKGRFIQAKLKLSGNNGNIYFFDSLNLFPSKLQKIGKELGLPKMKIPQTLIKGTNTEITAEQIEYCFNDSFIVLKAVEHFQDFVFENFGTSIGSTIAQTAQRIYLTHFTDHNLYVSGYDKFFRNSYYGGRVEVLSHRGIPTYAYYYDFNSLYPSVMNEIEYPDPEHLEYSRGNRLSILEYEGVSYVDVEVPKMFYPPLPYRANRLIFPVGSWSGWYNHNELRMALKYGVKIRIKKSIYSKKTVNPFKDYVKTLYRYRQHAKETGHTAESLYLKLLLNSLYGKFGQQVEHREYGFIFDEHDEGWVFEPYQKRDIGIWKKLESDGKIKKEDAKNSILTYASYTTSGARVKLYETIQHFVVSKGYDILYTDTDSIITTNPYIPYSKKLGDLDLEKQGIFTIYAPKAYEYIGDDGTHEIKLKGISQPDEIKDTYKKVRIVGVVEALRRKLKAGDPIEFTKKINLVDVKRVWRSRKISEPIDMDRIRKYQKYSELVKNEIAVLEKEISQKPSQHAGLVRNALGEVISRFGTYSNIPEWYREAKKQGFKKKEILRERAIYELSQLIPDFEIGGDEDGTNYQKIKNICFNIH